MEMWWATKKPREVPAIHFETFDLTAYDWSVGRILATKVAILRSGGPKPVGSIVYSHLHAAFIAEPILSHKLSIADNVLCNIETPPHNYLANSFSRVYVRVT